MTFTCIYCLKSHPAVSPSEAHIIPFVMGGSKVTLDAVCSSCNGVTTQQIEMRTLGFSLPFQNIFGIRGRRNGIKRVHGVLNVEELNTKISLNEHGEINEATVIPTTDVTGTTSYCIFGPLESIEQKQLTLAERYPDLKWQEIRTPGRPTVWIDFNIPLQAIELRRLAAKIAFEYFASLRGAFFVAYEDFGPVRSFIIGGKDVAGLVGLVSDRKQLDLFREIPPPYHTVWLVSQPRDQIMGAIVGLYSLFYYWVILSSRYPALWPMEELLIEDPQSREAERPLPCARTDALRLPWSDLLSAGTRDAGAAEKAAEAYAREKFNVARFYNLNS